MTQDALLDAILPDVPFDGWSDTAFARAADSLGMTPADARAVAPRGALDLAIAYHKRGDSRMEEAMAAMDLTSYRYRDKVALAIWLRLQVIDAPEAVQRATSMFSLPHLAPVGTQLVWGTADSIWRLLGDNSEDVNWWTKRATLSGVFGAVFVYWLGDSSEGKEATRAFIDRRIDDVMQIEKTKATVRNNPLLRTAFAPLTFATSFIRAPKLREDLPGSHG